MVAKSEEDKAKMKAEMSQAECNEKHMAMTAAKAEMAAKACSQATRTTAQEAHQAASKGQQANTKAQAQAMNSSHQEMMAKIAEGKSAGAATGCAMMHQKMMASASKTEPGVQATGQAGMTKKGCCCQKMAGSTGCSHMTKPDEKKETVTKTEIKTK